ncbi:hypothetical protein DPMN_181895 [Dreissena polymorpha]|uniref:Uncharacterized protein n=1 Tax=Dreissena polymorpha TaxID=45954 RepID=A0A9D4DEE8_DREPO|nr:hypothetical protein DPMN_181895 [Dreissena polymorpha]
MPAESLYSYVTLVNRCSDGAVPVVPGAVPVVSSAKPVIAGHCRSFQVTPGSSRRYYTFEYFPGGDPVKPGRCRSSARV